MPEASLHICCGTARTQPLSQQQTSKDAETQGLCDEARTTTRASSRNPAHCPAFSCILSSSRSPLHVIPCLCRTALNPTIMKGQAGNQHQALVSAHTSTLQFILPLGYQVSPQPSSELLSPPSAPLWPDATPKRFLISSWLLWSLKGSLPPCWPTRSISCQGEAS